MPLVKYHKPYDREEQGFYRDERRCRDGRLPQVPGFYLTSRASESAARMLAMVSPVSWRRCAPNAGCQVTRLHATPLLRLSNADAQEPFPWRGRDVGHAVH